ncbi:Fatty acid hydroxylase superfamily protein [Enhygromyxa salina]|uniref:Fatty acid hydroxylase superfamily protein n=1 Tax=Enhygromyxa salina TaxID=215803 RepID=A0A2S9XXX8_9BACT|nr:sterol desaturase family protein [Enhygromyxa salina]PRP97694.1 Fatty acid hydroxylase superfamily protein [Enhygromyxa salina]
MTEEHAINPIAFAVPLFLTAILLEAAIAKRQGKQGYYYFGTALADVASGTVFQALEVFFKFVPLLAYAWVLERYALIDWGESSWAVFLVGLIAVDFAYYWWHRYSHVINVLWAVHGVHHQSEDYNLAVALRQPILEPVTWFFFYVPLALLGIPVEVFLLAYALDLLYQFFIHTELVRKLPAPIEWVFNTPSHHRVHHGVQDQYLDKNYGGILIGWDRLFGTFEAEGERVVYGTTVPVHSYNPVWTNLDYFRHMGRLAAKATRARDKLWVWFAHPAWLPAGVERDPNEVKRLKSAKYRPAIPRELAWYLSGHYLLVGALMLVYLMFEAWYDWGQLAAGAGAIVLSSTVFLGLIEGKRWADWLELVRGPLVAGAVVYLASVWLEGWLLVGIGLGTLAMMWGSWNIWRAKTRASTRGR